MTNETERRSGGLFHTALVCFSALCCAASGKLYIEHPETAGPALLPLICAALMLASSLTEMIRSLIRGDGFRPRFFPRFWITLGFVCLYCALLLIGLPFCPASAAFLFGLLCCLRRGEIVKNALIALGSAGAVYLVFGLLLGIPL